MLRVLVALTAALALAPMAVAAPAHAGETWCADDPVVSVEGRLLDIRVEMPATRLLTTRSTTLTVIIPQNTSGRVVVDDVSAFPMKTTVVAAGPRWNGHGPLPVFIIVHVQSAVNYPVRVTATPLLHPRGPLMGSPLRSTAGPLASPATASGQSNVVLRMPMSLEH